MILDLNDTHKFEWEIVYRTVCGEILMQGKHYDFIPDKGDMIIVDDTRIRYAVINRTFDFDNCQIILDLLNIGKETNKG